MTYTKVRIYILSHATEIVFNTHLKPIIVLLSFVFMLIGQGPVPNEHSTALSSLVDKKYFRKHYYTEYREKHNYDEKTEVSSLSITKRHKLLLPPAARTHGGFSVTRILLKPLSNHTLNNLFILLRNYVYSEKFV